MNDAQKYDERLYEKCKTFRKHTIDKCVVFENTEQVNTEQVVKTLAKCEELTDEIKQKLYSLSEELNVNVNDLYLVFKTFVEKMKDDIGMECDSEN